ncbi:hypothetical protein EXVC032PBaldr_050 [Pelagibacter phage EXVC031P Hodr]|jgi:septation ring formation regulator EzrA|nr:hypothetical protein EXVC032PBaldr_050 [Pelagibacter phage EXVC031P Hodr]
MITKAIYELYSNVTTIRTNKNNGIKTYSAYDKNLKEVIVDMDAVNTKATQLQSEEKAIEDKKNTDAKSGNQKFLDMGLTQAEATALTGYTPPEESEE